jgi:hypothetical protein
VNAITLLDHYQHLAERTEKLPGTPAGELPEGVAYRLMHHTFGVTGEAGEIADAVKRR